MSIAEDIANLTAKFTEEKTQEVLAAMTLDELAQVWSDIKNDQEISTSSPEEKAAKDKDFAERSKVLHDVIPPETLQAKMNEYIEGLANGTYSAADFTQISEFCTDFNDEFKNDAIKHRLNDLQKNIADKRLSMEKEITIIPDEKLAGQLRIDGLDSIVIEGNQEKIAYLDNKSKIKGKTVTFKNSEGEDLAGVEFKDNKNADILMTDENGLAIHYLISGNTFSKEEEDGTMTVLDTKNLENIQDKKAFNFAASSLKVWNSYTKGELDNSIEKEIKVSEGKKADKEKRKKTKINQAGETTKISEGDNEQSPDEIAQTPTKFNEEVSQKKNEAPVNGDTNKDKPNAENELYWKEADIIDAMFKDWFLAAADAVTNWVVHQIEYTAAGIWDEFEKSYIERKAQRKKEIEQGKKKDPTQEFYGKIEETSDKYMKALNEGYTGQDKGKAKNEEVIQAIKDGKIDDVLANNELLKSLGGFNIDAKQLLTAGTPETTVPYVTGIATMAAKFADEYAKATILNERMNDKAAFKDRNVAELYESKRKEAMIVLQRQMIEDRKRNPNENASEIMFKSINECNAQMTEALKISIKDFDNGQYVDKGKNPAPNPILNQFESLAQPLSTLQDEAVRQQQTDENINEQRETVQSEESVNETRQEYIERKRKRIQEYKNKLENNPQQVFHAAKPRTTPKQINNIDPSTLRYIQNQNNVK